MRDGFGGRALCFFLGGGGGRDGFGGGRYGVFFWGGGALCVSLCGGWGGVTCRSQRSYDNQIPQAVSTAQSLAMSGLEKNN